MADAMFTPGPWLIHATNRVVCKAGDALKEITVENGKVDGDELPYSICLLRDPDDDFSEDETLANGFLIAAAPELYEALATLLAEVNSETVITEEAQVAASAALAKALGQ